MHKVKFLRGYGVGITLKENQLVLKNGKFPYSDEQDQESYFGSKCPYDRIVISGRGYLSTEAIKLLSSRNINVILTDTYGNPVTSMNHPMVSFAGTQNRIAQYDTFRDSLKVAYLQKQILYAKFESQIRFLSSLKRDVSKEISLLKSLQKQIAYSDTRRMIAIEAVASSRYFEYYTTLFPSKYNFRTRHGVGYSTKQNASDVINALLNYGYTVLAGEITKHINGLGLDAYYGFYHKNHESFQSLVYDLIEPFRWLVEKTVYRLGNMVNKKYQIHKKDYAYTKEGMVVMDCRLINKFLEMLEMDFHKTREYEYTFGIKKRNGLSNCQEIIIAKIAVQNLADFCTGKQKTFSI